MELRKQLELRVKDGKFAQKLLEELEAAENASIGPPNTPSILLRADAIRAAVADWNSKFPVSDGPPDGTVVNQSA